jgi:lipoprotein-anchoring transpeptidase ErfK/SrfK
VFSGRYTPLLKSHTIQPGDSLSTLAARFITTADSIRRINQLKSDVIQPGQHLKILRGAVKLHVDKSDFRLWATIDGRVLFEFPIGLGRDNATPVGTFAVAVRQKDPTWWRPGQAAVPPGDPANVLGSRWLGFQATTDYAGFGIHGTQTAAEIGKESSAGCIRLLREDIELVYDFVRLGTEVQIQE